MHTPTAMNASLLSYYEAIERASADMLDAARIGDWDHVIKLEGACVPADQPAQERRQGACAQSRGEPAQVAHHAAHHGQRRRALFSGFNADLVGTAWIGFDQERSLGDLEEGGLTALPRWIYFMREALRGRPEQRLGMPEGVITARVSPLTGELASPDDPDAFFEYFLADHPPSGTGAADASGTAAPRRPEEPLF